MNEEGKLHMSLCFGKNGMVSLGLNEKHLKEYASGNGQFKKWIPIFKAGKIYWKLRETTEIELIGKDPDAGKDWWQEKAMTKDETVGWHHQLNGCEFKQTQGDS